MLFKNEEDLKRYLAANQRNISKDTMMPYVEQAEIRYLIPFVGQEFYDELEAAYNSEAGPTAEQTLAINRLQRALAYYALQDALPFLNVQIGNLGIQEPSSDKSSPARQWSYNEVVKATSDNADTFLDNALSFLEKNASEYPTWKGSEAYTVSKELFINNASELSAYLNVNQSRRVYLMLRVFIARAEDRYIRPALCDALFSEMKAHVLQPEVDAPAYRVVLHEKIRKALAQMALYEAVPEVHFVMTSFGLKLQGEMLAAGNKLTPDLSLLTGLKQNAHTLGSEYLAELKRYLDENASEIESYGKSPCYQSTARRRYELPDNSNKASFRV